MIMSYLGGKYLCGQYRSFYCKTKSGQCPEGIGVLLWEREQPDVLIGAVDKRHVLPIGRYGLVSLVFGYSFYFHRL